MKILISFLLCLFSFSIIAQDKTWMVNKDHSEILFEIPYMNLSEVTGRFSSFSGKAEMNENGEITATNLVIEVASLDTGNRMRDGHLKSAEFLRAKDFPIITFTSTSVNNNVATGVLAIRDIRRLIKVDITLSKMAKDTWGFENRFVKFKTKILRSDFNLNWNKTLADNKYLVGDDITLKGSLQLQPTTGKTPTTKHMIPDTHSIREREKTFRGEQELKSEVALQAPVTSQKGVSPSEVVRTTRIIEQRPQRSLLWWSSFLFLGLLGFVASILMGAQIKRYLAQIYHEKYVESGLLGNLTDLIVVLIVLLYAMAFWIVGWGV